MLISPLSSASYTVSLVGIDGRVVASQVASTPGTVTCAGQAAGVVPPPVSTSNSRVYFMDALGVVRYLAPNGDAGQVITLPIGPARRSLFAVSPDDALMAVVVIDFVAGGANTSLYMYQLQPGGAQLLLFRQTGSYILWPTGWHGTTNLVLAKVPSCTQGGGPLCCGPQEFHVVDPKTAVRRFTVGGAACVISGPPSPAGAVCEDTTAYAQAKRARLDRRHRPFLSGHRTHPGLSLARRDAAGGSFEYRAHDFADPDECRPQSERVRLDRQHARSVRG